MVVTGLVTLGLSLLMTVVVTLGLTLSQAPCKHD